MQAAWEVFEQVRARHNYDIHKPYDPRDVDPGDSGMYNCRHIGNDPDRPWSTHAWAGALDANWRTNPDGSRLITDMPVAMRDDLHALRTKSGAPVFRWGGDWDRDPRTDHSYYDAMHWEIAATPAEIASGILDPGSPRNPGPRKEDEMVEDIRQLHEVYLGANPDPRKWNKDMLTSFDYHLEWYANGRPLNAIRGDFARTARIGG